MPLGGRLFPSASNVFATRGEAEYLPSIVERSTVNARSR